MLGNIGWLFQDLFDRVWTFLLALTDPIFLTMLIVSFAWWLGLVVFCIRQAIGPASVLSRIEMQVKAHSS